MLDEIGGFDPGFRMYCEDIDLNYRAAKAGWERWYVPAAVVRHEYAAVIDRRFLTRHTLWHARAMLRFLRKHPERPLAFRRRRPGGFPAPLRVRRRRRERGDGASSTGAWRARRTRGPERLRASGARRRHDLLPRDLLREQPPRLLPPRRGLHGEEARVRPKPAAIRHPRSMCRP